MRYSDYEQRRLDEESGRALDRLDEAYARAEAFRAAQYALWCEWQNMVNGEWTLEEEEAMWCETDAEHELRKAALDHRGRP